LFVPEALALALLALSGCPGTGPGAGDSYRSVSVVRDEGVLTLSWEAAPEAEGYRLYIAEGRDDTQGVQPLDIEDPVYIMTHANSGSVYYFWIKAVTGGAEAEDWWARGRAAMPVAAPAEVILSRTYTSIYVFWDPVNGATSYEVYYSRINNSGGAEKWTGPIEANSTEIQNLKNNVSYYVWVRALGPEGPSPFSGTKNTVTGEPKRPAVPNITWTIRMKNAVGAIWSPAENAVSYDFCYGTGTDPAAGTVINVKDTVCLAEDLPRNVNYRIWVRGKNTQYVSDWTQVCEVKTGWVFPEAMEGTFFSRWPTATRGGSPYYMDGYQIGKVRDMRRDFPFNKTKFADPKYDTGLPGFMVDAGITRDLPGGASCDDDDQYALHHFGGVMGIVRAVLEPPRATSTTTNKTVLELFRSASSPLFEIVRFTYHRDDEYHLWGANQTQASVSQPKLTAAVLKGIAGDPVDVSASTGGISGDTGIRALLDGDPIGIVYPAVRLGHPGDTMNPAGDPDADFHPQLLRPEPLALYLVKKLGVSQAEAINIANSKIGRAHV
jgi:hypothetical protein